MVQEAILYLDIPRNSHFRKRPIEMYFHDSNRLNDQFKLFTGGLIDRWLILLIIRFELMHIHNLQHMWYYVWYNEILTESWKNAACFVRIIMIFRMYCQII